MNAMESSGLVNSEKPLWSMEKLRGMSRGNAQFEARMFHLFQEQTAARLIELERALAAADFRQAGEIAHKMKPALDSFCISELHDVVRRLEEAPEQPENQSQADAEKLILVLRAVLADMAKTGM